jgi:membrane associated rhomboid family serine protease
VTQALVAINVAVFIAEIASGTPAGGASSGTIIDKGGLFGPALTGQNMDHIIAGTHQYWRLVSSGFLHYSVLHVAFNMFFLYILGSILEPAIGHLNFAVLYFTSLLAGSFGALLFTPDAVTVGASGACFGVLGGMLVVAYYRHIPIWQSGLGVTLLINIVFSLSVRGISIGGHLGGLIGGMLAGFLIMELADKRRMQAAAIAGCVLVAAASVVGALAVAGNMGIAPHGVGFGG